MGHSLQAIIGATETLRQIVGRFSEAHATLIRGDGNPISLRGERVNLTDQLSIIPATEAFLDELCDAYGVSYMNRVEEFTYLGGGLERLLAEYSQHTPLAYIETNYFGGSGYQSGAAYVGGERVRCTSDRKEPCDQFDPSSWPINSALEQLGIVAYDAFDRLHLVRWRSTEALLEEAQQDSAEAQ